MLAEKRNFGRKSEFSSKTDTLSQNLNFRQKQNFGKKIKLWPEIEILTNNQNFG